ncbi:bifunctional 2-polyprenyl-6-hydroxyphenol methylase/3-demethylubiquinol 3-O-methyltransferase UbiG [Bradyrhizobium jicamae]|uniref:class I SAM-dependent methyltransferase n=1 Tax=Bradyrhizobium jicamae TaxID=280332 RepID=UPI001BA586C2|nr:class I SAM-dependent methyltransferase [Bradyrhizobium jicamae]MBR0933564.1 methyltransferase domain-containing protein [Bradyrhizobium jicamae]
MSIETAAAITRVFGPCQIVQWNARDSSLLQELLLLGCDAYAVGQHSFENSRWISSRAEVPVPHKPIAVVEVAAEKDALLLIDTLASLDHLQNLFLIGPGFSGVRRPLENQLFARGWRRHPASLAMSDYEGMRDDMLPLHSIYQRVPAQAAAGWPVEDLLRERNLHMDMLRESGSRADAHVVRYALAASLVRPGDVVLDCACGLGYGSAVIAATTQASKVIGVDVDADTVAYANANYGEQNVRFEAGDASALAHIPDASVDFIVSMETIEHVENWKAVAKEFARVLKPDGRLVASVPDRWMDDTGNDPNPYHYHVFDWSKLCEGLAEDFVLESRYVQTAPGGFKWPQTPRQLRRVPFESGVEGEWILVVASANPFARAEELRASYRHPAFADALSASGAVVVDFGSHYDNPWLYRTLVQVGERFSDNAVLGRLAHWVAENARPGSADQGAALCVTGYRILERRQAKEAGELVRRIESYCRSAEDTTNPHVQRWRISLAFLAGCLSELSGALDDALKWFSLAARLDWRSFSPILTTKTIAAAFHAARIALTFEDEAKALSFFQIGFDTALEAARSDPGDFAGSSESPIPFGLAELGEVMDMGSQCAIAIAVLPLRRRAPSAFWSRVNSKRFGLLAWNQALEQENAWLRNQLHQASRR